MKGFRLAKNRYKLSVSVSQRHCFEQKSMKYFDTLEHPFAKSLLDIYVEKTKEPLWISCYAYGASPFPNKKASKRVAHALRDALAAAGYDRCGRRVLVNGESSVIADLYGTLRVIVSDPQAACNAKFVDVLENARSIISSVEKRLRRDNNGQHIEQQQYPPTRSAKQVQGREHDSRQGQRGGQGLSSRPGKSTSPGVRHHGNEHQHQHKHRMA
jgi:hypothetical protein